MGRISEPEFKARMVQVLMPFGKGVIRSVVGPGRSGQIAAVYASHILGAAWLPPTMKAREIPARMRPVLAIDTAARTGATLRRLVRVTGAEYSRFLFTEPPLLRFWYEGQEP